jgi:hypothetical protein
MRNVLLPLNLFAGCAESVLFHMNFLASCAEFVALAILSPVVWLRLWCAVGPGLRPCRRASARRNYPQSCEVPRKKIKEDDQQSQPAKDEDVNIAP